MKELDPGHKYEVDNYYSFIGDTQTITFMKREGENYPFNVGHYSGTNSQELLRILISRCKYLMKQKGHKNNFAILDKFREILWLFEDRAAEVHGFNSFPFKSNSNIEEEPVCKRCGHIMCKGHFIK